MLTRARNRRNLRATSIIDHIDDPLHRTKATRSGHFL
jgi:hypothetical protein